MEAYLHQPLPVCVQDVANAFFHSYQELKHLANPPKHSKIIEIVKQNMSKNKALKLSVVE